MEKVMNIKSFVHLQWLKNSLMPATLQHGKISVQFEQRDPEKLNRVRPHRMVKFESKWRQSREKYSNILRCPDIENIRRL